MRSVGHRARRALRPLRQRTQGRGTTQRHGGLADSETQTVLSTNKIEGHAAISSTSRPRLREDDHDDRAVRPRGRSPHVPEAPGEPRRVRLHAARPRLLYRSIARSSSGRARCSMGDRAGITIRNTIRAERAVAQHPSRTGWSVDPSGDHAAATRCAEMALERDPLDARALALSGQSTRVPVPGLRGRARAVRPRVGFEPRLVVGLGFGAARRTAISVTAAKRRGAAAGTRAVAARPPPVLHARHPRSRRVHHRRVRRGCGLGQQAISESALHGDSRSSPRPRGGGEAR